MNLSKRAQAMPASPIRKLVPYAEEAKKKGKHVYHLNIGQPDIPTPPEFFEGVKKFPATIDYAHSAGIQACREAMQTYYNSVGIPLELNQIQITTGGSEALLFAMAAVTDPGDEVLVFEPFYTNYNGFATLLDITLVPITTQAETGYHLPDLDSITARINDKTKALILCNPNNPTGTVFTKEEMQTLATLVKEKELFFISDEVYREFIYDGLNHTSVMEFKEIEDRAILTDSVSKRYSLCGARIGVLASRNNLLMDTVLRMGQARLSTATLEQLGCVEVTKLPPSYYQGIIDEYQKRRNSVYKHLQAMDGIVCKEPKGAFYVFAKLPIKDSDHFAQWMLTDFSRDNQTVMVAPGPGFYASKQLGTDEIRIAYVLKEEDLDKAMTCLAAALDEYKKHF